MRFSIIVPVYNVEKYIEQCVNSVLEQTYSDFELILVDDGSPDNSSEICDRLSEGDCRISVIHKENGGLSDARNAGIRAATGDYVLFIDADDFWSTTTVLEQIASLLDSDRYKVVQFGYDIYSHTEDKFIRGRKRDFARYNGKSFDEIVYNLVANGGLEISACSMAIERKFLIENNLYFVKGIKTEDLEWAVRVFLLKPDYAYSDDYFYAYRKGHGNTISSNVDYKHLCDYCWILEKSIERIEKRNGNIKSALESYMMYHVLIACAHCYRSKIEKKQRKEILSRLKGISKNRILKYTLDKKVKLAGIIYRFAGFSVMAKVLGFYLINRGR